MNQEERLTEMLRAALEPGPRRTPPRDLWPLIVERSRSSRNGWPWLDLAIAAAVVIVLVMHPGWLWLLAYHL